MLREFSNSWISFLKGVLPKRSEEISGNIVDWKTTSLLHKNIDEDFIMEFDNVIEGKDVTILLHNISGSTVSVTLPDGVLIAGAEGILIPANTKTLFNFFLINGKIFGSVTHNSQVHL